MIRRSPDHPTASAHPLVASADRRFKESGGARVRRQEDVPRRIGHDQHRVHGEAPSRLLISSYDGYLDGRVLYRRIKSEQDGEGGEEVAEAHDATGAGLDLFLEWAGRTGELNANTAAALRGTCRGVLAVDEASDSSDVAALDVEALLDRWENLNRTRYSSGSLATYRSRFRQSVAMYKAWLTKDPDWKAAGRSSPSKGTRGAAKPGRPRKNAPTQGPADASPFTEGAPTTDEPSSPSGPRLVAYEMPLRPNLLVRLTLPVDLTTADADRLSAFVSSLAFVANKAPQ